MIRLRPGRPRTVLVVAPHSDDETIGAFGLIRSLRRRGTHIRIVVVTDGAGSHPGSRAWPRARLVAERRRETRRAMRRVGVCAGDVDFLALPDGNLDGADRGQMLRIARAARRIVTLDMIVAPANEDAHPDHRAVAQALARTPLPGVRRLSYLVWGRRRRGVALPLGAARAMKRSAIRRYRTQMGAITDDPAGFAIAPHELRAFSRPCEIFVEESRCGRSR